ncbi:13132_t:CDS:2, partial [Entrophospora sp. SA101]
DVEERDDDEGEYNGKEILIKDLDLAGIPEFQCHGPLAQEM